MKTCLTLAVAATLMLAPAAGAAPCKGADGYSAAFGGRRTFEWSPDALERSKTAKGPAYERLITDADKALTAGPWSVTTKTRTPPSGDKHDYMSMGPYWWPDPAQPNGEPYVRRDGQVNPERATGAFDRTAVGDMANAVEALGLAYYYTGDEKYAARATLILRTWFLDPATRMNPNVNFGQGVPGRTRGRAEGLIDMENLIAVVEAIGLLGPSRSLTAQDTAGLKTWFSDMTDWMLSDPLGRDEDAALNNHAVHYDHQILEYALFAGRTDVATKVAQAFAKRRIDPQIQPDGSQPKELERTRSQHYSYTNLSAMLDIAAMSQCVGVDLWTYKGPDGQGLRQAVDFHAGYANGAKPWTWQEISPEPEVVYEMLLKAARGYNDPDLAKKAALYAPTEGTRRFTLVN